MPTKLLTPAQAEAVYSAMCALNNVGAKLKAAFGSWPPLGKDGTNVFENESGVVRVVRCVGYELAEDEEYADQATFAAAYGLDKK
jgi:hypothetical protein